MLLYIDPDFRSLISNGTLSTSVRFKVMLGCLRVHQLLFYLSFSRERRVCEGEGLVSFPGVHKAISISTHQGLQAVHSESKCSPFLP